MVVGLAGSGRLRVMDQAPSAARPLVPASDVVARRLGEGAVLVHLPTNKIFELNETGARVWELIASGQTIAAMTRTLVDEYDVDPADAEAKIRSVVEDLSAAGLVR